jgi:hypothetical protein
VLCDCAAKTPLILALLEQLLEYEFVRAAYLFPYTFTAICVD